MNNHVNSYHKKQLEKNYPQYCLRRVPGPGYGLPYGYPGHKSCQNLQSNRKRFSISYVGIQILNKFIFYFNFLNNLIKCLNLEKIFLKKDSKLGKKVNIINTKDLIFCSKLDSFKNIVRIKYFLESL